MSLHPLDRARYLVRLRTKRSTLASTPDIPTLARRRKELQSEIDELTQALARLH